MFTSYVSPDAILSTVTISGEVKVILDLNHRECDSQRMKDLIRSKSLSLRTVAIQADVMFVDLGSSCSY